MPPKKKRRSPPRDSLGRFKRISRAPKPRKKARPLPPKRKRTGLPSAHLGKKKLPPKKRKSKVPPAGSWGREPTRAFWPEPKPKKKRVPPKRKKPRKPRKPPKVQKRPKRKIGIRFERLFGDEKKRAKKTGVPVHRISDPEDVATDSFAYFSHMNRSTHTEPGMAFEKTFTEFRKKGPFEYDDALIKGFGVFLRPDDGPIGKNLLIEFQFALAGTGAELSVVYEGHNRESLIVRFKPPESLRESEVREKFDDLRERFQDMFDAFGMYYDDFEWAVYFDTEDELY